MMNGRRRASHSSFITPHPSLARQSHRTTVTRVPRPTSDSISKTSTSRFEPGSPLPRPRPVEKPSRMAALMSGMPGPLSSKMSRSPGRLAEAWSGCAIMRPRRAYLTTLRASSDATVARRVWSTTRKPSAAASVRTSPRATAMSCSHSRKIDLLCKGPRPPVSRPALFVLVDAELAAQEPDAFVHVKHRVHPAQLQAQLDERDGDRGLHADDHGARVHDAGHRRDVREHAPDEGVNHLKQRDVDEHAARARPLKLGEDAL